MGIKEWRQRGTPEEKICLGLGIGAGIDRDGRILQDLVIGSELRGDFCVLN